MTEKCCANCKNYCEGSGKMTTCLNAHYEYECHEPDYVCDRWVGKTAAPIHYISPATYYCPACGTKMTDFCSTSCPWVLYRCEKCKMNYKIFTILESGKPRKLEITEVFL